MTAPPPWPISQQIFWLMILAIPVATVSRTVVAEEVIRETRQWCQDKSRACRTIWARKFFYVFTCEYCFSHWVALLLLWIMHFKLLSDDWRGYVIAWFALVLVANVYLNLYSRLRVEITSEKKEIEAKEKQIQNMENQGRSQSSDEPDQPTTGAP